MGVSFGLTQQLFNFWQRGGYEPMYIRQNASETTGEEDPQLLPDFFL
jgi:N-acetyltransferase 10